MKAYNAGDHLVSPRNGYNHHGLYLGNGKVIHYTGFSDGKSRGAIAITSLHEFCSGHVCHVQFYLTPTFSPEVRIERALSRLGEDWYDVLLNNCEHFVTWCVLGIHSSHQVNRLIASAAVTRQLLNKPIAETIVKATGDHLIQHSVSSATAAGSGPTVSTVAGLIAGGGVAASSTATTAVVAGVVAASAAPVMATVGVGIAVGYGVKRLVGWLWD